MRRGVVFDIDDTLYLERDYVRSGFEAVGQYVRDQHGAADFFEVSWRLFTEGRRGDIFDRALDLVGAPEGAVSVSRLIEVYREHVPSIELLGDSDVVLSRLQSRSAPVAVVTDGPASSQHNKVDALGLRDRVAEVVVTSELGLGHGKPHEGAFLRIQHQLGLSGGQLVYVADNPAKDFVAPHHLGWRTLRIRRPGSLHEHVASGPDVDNEIRNLDEAELP